MSKKHGRFISPEAIHGISPPMLLRLVEPHRSELEPHGVITPDGVSVEALSRLLEAGEPGGLPVVFLEELAVVQEMGTVDNADEMLQCARAGGRPIEATASASDLVVHLLRTLPAAISRLVAKQRPTARRKFRTFPAADIDFTPVHRVSQQAIELLRNDLDSCLVERGRCRGTEVHEFEAPGGFRLMIRRGELLHREPTFDEGTGKRKFVSYHPERFDIIIHDVRTGELHISAQQEADVKMYREKIGRQVFGIPLLFMAPGTPNMYTLHPLIDDGPACLECGGITGLKKVELLSVSVSHPHYGDYTTIYESKGDLFRDLASDGVALSARGSVPFAAKFRVTIENRRKPVTLKLTLPNSATFTRDGDGMLINAWLSDKKFRTGRKGASDGPAMATA